MELHITDRDLLQIDKARITFRNFSGRRDMYNTRGDREFHLVIPNQEIADRLLANRNRFGVPWNVKIKAPQHEGENPFIHMKVKLAYKTDAKGRQTGPDIYLKSGNKTTLLDEEAVSMLDSIDIESVDMDVRPFDGNDGPQGPYRSAWLSKMWVTQRLDRFAARFAEEEAPEEDPFY